MNNISIINTFNSDNINIARSVTQQHQIMTAFTNRILKLNPSIKILTMKNYKFYPIFIFIRINSFLGLFIKIKLNRLEILSSRYSTICVFANLYTQLSKYNWKKNISFYKQVKESIETIARGSHSTPYSDRLKLINFIAICSFLSLYISLY